MLQYHLDNPSFEYPSTPSLLRQQSPIDLMIVDILIRLAANLCAILLLRIQLFDMTLRSSSSQVGRVVRSYVVGAPDYVPRGLALS